MQSTLGGVGPSGTTLLDRRTADQTYTFSATPYLRERFGDLLTAEIGTRVGYTSKDLLDNSLLTGPSNSTAHQYMNSLREYAGFTLGPAFGRTSGGLTGSATQMDGTGVSRHAHRNSILLDLGYGITRSFTALVTTGYEDILYHTVPDYQVNEGVWRAGFRWAPEPDSSITATYGRQYGINALRLDAAYALTPHSRLFVRYSEEVTSELQDLQDAVTSSILDPFGSPVDPLTGAPLLLSSNFYSSQLNNVLTRTSTGSVSMALLFDRDTIALTATYRRQKPIGFAPNSGQGITFVTEKDVFGSIGWSHDVNPNLRLNTFFEYGTRSGGNLVGSGNIHLFVASVSALSRTERDDRAYGCNTATPTNQQGLSRGGRTLSRSAFAGTYSKGYTVPQHAGWGGSRSCASVTQSVGDTHVDWHYLREASRRSDGERLAAFRGPRGRAVRGGGRSHRPQ